MEKGERGKLRQHGIFIKDSTTFCVLSHKKEKLTHNPLTKDILHVKILCIMCMICTISS